MKTNKTIRFLFSTAIFFTISNFALFSTEALDAETPDISSAQHEFVMITSTHDYDLNPQTANYSQEAQILTGLYEGLFSYDPYTLEPNPAIAESFIISRDKKRWTFNLRHDAYFSNGTIITSQTIKDAWIALLNPNLKAPFASLLDCIAGAASYRTGIGNISDIEISTPDDYTLVVRLTTPTEHFSKILCHHAFSAVPPAGITAYSGAYKLKLRTATEIILEKNTLYYDAKNVLIPSIRIVSSDDNDENTYRFNTGTADWLTDSVTLESVIDRTSVKIATQFGTEYMFFKSHRAPWNNAALRNALLTAVPWDKLRSSSLVQADTLIMPLSGYPEVIGLGDDQNIDDAIVLLKEAGYDSNGKSISGDNPQLKITIAIPDSEYMFSQAKLLADAWEQLGVEVIIQKTPSERYLNSISNWDADIFTYTWIGDFADPIAFLELFRGGSSLSECYWDSTEYDKLLTEAAKQTSQVKRYELLAQAEQILLDSGVIIPISHPVSLNVIDTQYVGGWYDNALDIHPFKYLYFNKAIFSQNVVLADKSSMLY